MGRKPGQILFLQRFERLSAERATGSSIVSDAGRPMRFSTCTIDMAAAPSVAIANYTDA
jgi:hypothetical protein